MIEITNLQKSFGDLKVLNNINLNINDGEIYGLIGMSGAGKSTLLNCINGIEDYDCGSIRVNSKEVKSLGKDEKRLLQKDIGMIFQQFPMLSRKTVFQNIAFPMECWHYEKSEIEKKVKELASIVKITDKLDSKPAELSGGQKQRVAIARALSMDPKVLLSDEATSALDPITTASILDLLKDVQHRLGITIIVVTHEVDVIRKLCNRVSLLESGEIVASGPVEAIFAEQPEELRRFLGKSDYIGMQTGVNLQIILKDGDRSKYSISKLSQETGVDFVICGGNTERYRDNLLGDLVINVSNINDAEKVKNYLNASKITWHPY